MYMQLFWQDVSTVLILVAFYLVIRSGQRRQEREREAKAASEKAALEPIAPTPLEELDNIVTEAESSDAARKLALAAEAEARAKEKFALDHTAQLRQAISLATEVNNLEADFTAYHESVIKPRLESADLDQATRKTLANETMIAREQIRITKSYVSELMRFVMAPFQDASARPYYVPTQDQASWAFTAAKLTLGFAKNRIASLKS